MKILGKNMREGRITLRIEVLDDLWYLSDIISEGDVVSAKTKRRVELEREIPRAERIDKRTFTLGIKADNIEFDPNVDRLRVTGRIVEGPEALVPIGDYHTLNLAPGNTLVIRKENWSNSDLVKVKDSENTVRAKVLLVAMEEGSASLGLLRNYGIRNLGTISQTIAGKDDLKQMEAQSMEFFVNLSKAIEDQSEELDRVIIAGPGFVKDNFYKHFKERSPELAKKVLVESVSMAGQKGLEEIVKRGIIERVVRESKLHKEVQYLNRLFEHIGKGTGLTTYGLEQVKSAGDMGAVETLLISNKLLRKMKIKKDLKIEELIENVEKMRGEIVIVSEEHELGMQLEGIGGIAAILRYRI